MHRTEIDRENPYALVFVDIESCGGPQQSLSGLRSIGIYIVAAADRRFLFEAEWKIKPLAGIDCPFQKAAFWDKHPEQWNHLNENPMDRESATHKIRELVNSMRDEGWYVHLLARPAAYH